MSADLNQGFLFDFHSLRSVEPFGFGAFFSLELVWSELFLVSVAGRCVRVCACGIDYIFICVDFWSLLLI